MASSFTEVIDITISDPPELNFILFDQWLAGKSINSDDISPLDLDFTPRGPKFVGNYSITEVSLNRLHRLNKADQYRMFNHLEHYLSSPLLLTPHLKIWFQIANSTQEKLIEKYYTYNGSVMKEVIYKKLAKSRKDLDDISVATRLPLMSVTRQSDNIKRMYTLLEETKQFQGNLIKFVETIYLLPMELCRQYASLLFLLYSKFNLTSKKTLLKIPCLNIERCASVIIALLLPDSDSFDLVARKYSRECPGIGGTYNHCLNTLRF